MIGVKNTIVYATLSVLFVGSDAQVPKVMIPYHAFFLLPFFTLWVSRIVILLDMYVA